MRVFVGTDHAGLEFKEHLKKALADAGYEPVDCGAFSTTPRTTTRRSASRSGSGPSPSPARSASSSVAPGNGEQIAANKVPGVRAALVWNISTAQLARQHNDANVVSFGARQHSDEEATELVLEFLKTPFSGDERHVRRIGLVSDYERDRHRPAGGLPTRS